VHKHDLSGAGYAENGHLTGHHLSKQ
jgi:hypothetical protein